MTYPHIVNWTNELAIHQSSLMRGLAELGTEVTVVAEQPVSADRRRLGWDAPDFGQASLVIKPTPQQVERLLQQKGACHIFGSGLDFSWGRRAAQEATRRQLPVGLMSEAADPDGWKGIARWAKHTMRRVRMGKGVDFILGMGSLGVEWFRRCGYPDLKILPFGYFVEPAHTERTASRYPRTDSFQIIYIGNLTPRKRVDHLLKAFAGLQRKEVMVDIVGDGEERTALQDLAKRLSISQQVRWHGALPNQRSREMLLDADLLVLPSRFDGWGAVVNEALMAGTPVVCTDRCGAADLVTEEWRGYVIPRNDIPALADALQRRANRGAVSDSDRRRIQNWSARIRGERGVQYLQQVLDHIYAHAPRPCPPWKADSSVR